MMYTYILYINTRIRHREDHFYKIEVVKTMAVSILTRALPCRFWSGNRRESGGHTCRGSHEKEVQKKANRPSGEQSRTLCVFFELKGGQLLIFPGGTSVIRHATHGVIYASRSYEREHGHWTRITRFDPLLPRLLLHPCLRVLRWYPRRRDSLSLSPEN